MATVNQVRPSESRTRFNEENYPLWKQMFPAELRQEMIADDLLAGRSVSLVLGTLITIGLVLAIVSVLCTI